MLPHRACRELTQQMPDAPWHLGRLPSKMQPEALCVGYVGRRV
jgi:hypothetical protein